LQVLILCAYYFASCNSKQKHTGFLFHFMLALYCTINKLTDEDGLDLQLYPIWMSICSSFLDSSSWSHTLFIRSSHSMLFKCLELVTPLAQQSKKKNKICFYHLLSATWEHHLSPPLKNKHFQINSQKIFLTGFRGPY